MKKSRSSAANYFDGTLTVGKTHIRLIGFDSKLQQQLASFHKKKNTVTISNCEVKPAKPADQPEVIVKRFSGSMCLPSKLHCQMMWELQYKHLLPLINWMICLSFSESTSLRKLYMCMIQNMVPNGKTKQYVFLADNTGTAKLVLWEDIGKTEK